MLAILHSGVMKEQCGITIQQRKREELGLSESQVMRKYLDMFEEHICRDLGINRWFCGLF